MTRENRVSENAPREAENRPWGEVRRAGDRTPTHDLHFRPDTCSECGVLEGDAKAGRILRETFPDVPILDALTAARSAMWDTSEEES